MFLSSYVHSLDSKNRLTIPSKYRDQLATGLVLTPNAVHPCIDLYPQSEWEKLTEAINQLKLLDPDASDLRRLVFSDAEDLRPDGQGRIVLNQDLREHANIETEVLLAGGGNSVELWNPAAWREHRAKQRSDRGAGRTLLTSLKV